MGHRHESTLGTGATVEGIAVLILVLQTPRAKLGEGTVCEMRNMFLCHNDWNCSSTGYAKVANCSVAS